AAGLLAMMLPAICLYTVYRTPPLEARPERINPNTASLASLVRLPGIGKARALDLIAYRSAQPQPAFRSANDLEAIKGIGPKTAEMLAPWLTFEEEQELQMDKPDTTHFRSAVPQKILLYPTLPDIK
ncbi:MAG TPA: helix-hairpin-helix domain-containing protein, partial [Anaerohalosphaeraceae bacterium]|nr:helix-hairpin-helix domain-containing protein [Anaerohalosphaeraceae bacterium]